MKQAEYEIINTVDKLLSDGKVDLFIGYEKGTLPLKTTPYFVSKGDDTSRLVWNSFCSNNLTVYLSRVMSMFSSKEAEKRVGIMCKGCDSRSLAGLIKENQVNRDNLFIVGVSCPGIVDSKKILTQLDQDEIVDVSEDADSIKVRLKDKERVFERKDYLYDSCLNCSCPTPTVYDVLIRTTKFAPQVVSPDPSVKEFMHKSREERWKIFESEVARCVRCYACRNACPNCYCKECFAEQTHPQWISVTNDLSDLMFYHTVRIFHQAGRCVDCGACVRACPMDIDLRIFTRMLVDEVKERFDYEPGLSADELPPLAAFKIEDKQEFMTEPLSSVNDKEKAS
jgi:formate dehydrogenase subunit beta